MTRDNIKIGRELQSKITGMCKLYRVLYEGIQYYAVVHRGSGFITIFEDKKACGTAEIWFCT